MWGDKPIYPYYNDDNDYNTNAPSYYDDLARKQKLLEMLASRIWEYDKILASKLKEISDTMTTYMNEFDKRLSDWDSRLAAFDDSVITLLNEWIDDGTFAEIINEEIFKTKADVDDVNARFQSVDQLLKYRSYVKYDSFEFDKYEGLKHNVPFNVWRDVKTGQAVNDFKIDRTGYVKHYISATGDGANDGKTPEKANSRLNALIPLIEADSTVSKAEIVFLGQVDRSRLGFTLNQRLAKDYIISAEKPLASNQAISTFTAEVPRDTFKAKLNYRPMGVVRVDETTEHGRRLELVKTDSYNECILTENAYYYDELEKSLYVHKKGTTAENTLSLVDQSMIQMQLTRDDQVIILDNLTILNGSSSQPCYIESDTGTKGTVIINNCLLENYGNRGNSANGFSTNGIKNTYVFNSKAFNVIRDAFNYHNIKDVNGGGFVFEFNCYAENVGLEANKSGNNNISTAHEGIHIIRIGTKGLHSQGPLIADVNACYSVNIDCDVFDTGLKDLSHNQNAAYYFDDSGNFGSGKAWLVNCGGGSQTEWSINSDESFKAKNKIFIDNFKGMYIPTDQNLTLMN